MNQMLLLTIVPLAAGALLLCVPDRLKTLCKAVAVAVTAGACISTLIVFMQKPVVWQSGRAVVFLADNLSAFIGLAVAACAFLVAVYSCGSVQRAYGRYFGYVCMTLSAALGVAYANHLLVLLISWGFLAAMLFLMVNLQGTDDAARAARKALVIIGGTDALLMFGIALIWMVTGSFSVKDISLGLDSPLTALAYLALAIAAFAKAGAMPFHSWLPDVAESAPAGVSAYLPASLDKLLGIYLLARASLDLFVMTPAANLLLLVVGAFTIIVAVMMALVQHSMKRLLGYHAVSQVGYMVLGIGTGNAIGIAGALFHMVNNAVYKSCLFMSAGAVEKRTGTVELSSLGALWRVMPVTFGACLVASLSISGIPPFNGFVSKWMIYQGIIETATPRNPLWIVWLVAAMFGSALTVASFMKLLHATFLGRGERDWKGLKDVGIAMGAPQVILAGLCIIFGVFATAVPLALFIMPVLRLPVTYLGTWSPVAATVLLLAGLLAGGCIYLFFRPGAFRATETFVGGEDPDSLERVSGAEFYTTIGDIGAVSSLYKKEEAGAFDFYDRGKRFVYFWTGRLQRLHNGIIASSLVWCLLGMAVMFVVVLVK